MTAIEQPSARERIAVIKVGTEMIWEGSDYHLPHMQHICEQIHAIREAGWQTVLVSSGAVAWGREYFRRKEGCVPAKEDETPQLKQMYATKGNIPLMNAWLSCDEQCTQILTHRPDLRLGHIIDVIRTTLSKNELPIVNGNDAANISELKYTDNDNLSTRIAAMIRASWHISLTSTGGIQGENGKVISIIQPGDMKWLQFIRHEQSKNGRGGMRRKGRLSSWLANEKNIPASIAGGKKRFLEEQTIEGILLDADSILNGEQSIGTTFLPRFRTS